MTVDEMIAHLKEMPGHLEVKASGSDNDGSIVLGRIYVIEKANGFHGPYVRIRTTLTVKS